MEDDKEMGVPEKLRVLQEHFGLTLQEMADRCGLPKRSLENYMRLNKPQRPGLDAICAIADGLDVSIDWLVGRSDEHLAPEFKTEDYAIFCHSVVLRLLGEMRSLAMRDPKASDTPMYKIGGIEISDIAAAAMLDFIAVVDTQVGNSSRPKGYFESRFDAITKGASKNGDLSAIANLFERKP